MANAPRVIFYATSSGDTGPLILCAQNGEITHAILGLFHLGYDDETNKTDPYVHFNNQCPTALHNYSEEVA